MVAVIEKIGTLCIEYRPPETISNLVFDDGIFTEDDCDQFIIYAPFEARFVELLPIYYIDPRCYTSLKIKSYSFFDALDFCKHLSLSKYEITFLPNKIDNELQIVSEKTIKKVYMSGNQDEYWSLRIQVDTQEFILVNENWVDTDGRESDFRIIYEKK